MRLLDSMKGSTRSRLLLAVGALCVAAGIAVATTPASVTPKAGTQPVSGVYTYNVKPNDDTNILDIHFFKVKGTPSFPDGAPTGWTCSGPDSNGDVVWRGNGTGAQAVPAGGMNIAITGTTPSKDDLVKWTLTNDGALKIAKDGSNVIRSGPQSGDPSTHGPVASNLVTSPTTCMINATTPVVFNSTEYNQSFTVYKMSTGVGCPDPQTDFTDFTAFVASHPIPPAWSLVFSGMSGTTDPTDGHSNAPQIAVPNNSGLIGDTFCIVIVVNGDASWPSGTVIGSDPIQFTITGP